MFKHTVTIFRSDTTAPFFYDHDNTMAKLEYVEMRDAAKLQGKLLEETYVISSDGLILERSVTWDTQQSFTEFMLEWETLFPAYRTNLQEYSQENGHFAFLSKE